MFSDIAHGLFPSDSESALFFRLSHSFIDSRLWLESGRRFRFDDQFFFEFDAVILEVECEDLDNGFQNSLWILDHHTHAAVPDVTGLALGNRK